MEKQNVNYLVAAFLFLIVGIALIGSIASNINEKTDKSIVYDESSNLATSCTIGSGDQSINESTSACNITVVNVPTSWKTLDCPLTNVVVMNTSAGTFPAITEGTDYNLYASTGIIQMLNTTNTDAGDFNTTYVDYTYCGDDYLNSSWGRTVLKLVAGFFALALLGVSLWLFYNVFKSTGIIK